MEANTEGEVSKRRVNERKRAILQYVIYLGLGVKLPHSVGIDRNVSLGPGIKNDHVTKVGLRSMSCLFIH